MSRFINQFKYHAKRTFALIFIVLAIALEVANFILGIYVYISTRTSSLSFIWNFAILMVCYVRMLKGNVENDMRAMMGVLTFIILSTITLAFDSVYSVIMIGASSDTVELIIYIVLFAIIGGEAALGIITSIKLRRLLYGYGRTNIKQVKILAGFFFGLLVAGQALYIAMWIVLGLASSSLISLFLIFLSPLGEFFAAIAAWITLSRIE